MSAAQIVCPCCLSGIDAAGPELAPLLQARIDAEVVARCEADAWRWRLRLIGIETVMMGSLVFLAGVTLDQPLSAVLSATLMVAASCFASGILLLGLSNGAGRIVRRVRRRWS